jgi:transcriptional regulator with XRE-family HTH domain/quercetin dioxygenase-like cupin family protein
MPVFATHLLDYAGLGIGTRVREERVRVGWTLRELALKLGVSEAKLSNMERGKVSLDLAELALIAQALGAPLPTFFPPDTVRHYYIKRHEEVSAEAPIVRELLGPEAGPSTHHNPVWPLADPFVGKHMEPIIAEIQPLPDDQLHFIAHDHEEFMFVLSGEVETRLKTNDGVAVEHLSAGDALYFRSNLPHCHRSASNQPARTINIIYSLRGAIDPDDSELSASGRRFYRRGVYADPVREAAAKIALLRRSRGLTLAELAEEIGIGSRQLAAIEEGEKAPALDLLLRLARYFRRPMEYFFATTLDHQPYYFLQRGSDIATRPLHRRRASADHHLDDIAFRALAEGFPDRGLHPYYGQAKANHAEPPLLHEHHGQVFVYVLQGEIELVAQVGGHIATEPLRAGDSVFFESSVPHRVRGRSHNPLSAAAAELIVVFWSPLGETYLFDPVRSEN